MNKSNCVYQVIVCIAVILVFDSCTKARSYNESGLETKSTDIVDHTNYYTFEDPIKKVVNTNDGSELNIREYPFDGKVIAQLSDGMVISLIKRTSEKYTIGQLSDYWYYTIVEIDGKEINGWLYGGYLSEISEKLSVNNIYADLDLSDDSFKIAEIKFTSEIDKNTWKLLAGYYFVGDERKTIDVIEESNSPWGKDYSFGIGCHSISYQDGKWCHGGDGEALFYTLNSVSKDGKSFNMESDYGSNEVWRIDGEYLYLSSNRYYKFTGPDCYKRFIKKHVEKYNKSIKQFNTGDNYGEILHDISFQILNALNNGDFKSVSKFINRDSSINLVIGDYQGKSNFTYDELNSGSEEVVKAFELIKSDLKTHDNLLSINPVYNQFMHINTERFKEKYPDSDVLVEYTLNDYEEITFIFKKINGKMILTTIIDYAVFRA